MQQKFRCHPGSVLSADLGVSVSAFKSKKRLLIFSQYQHFVCVHMQIPTIM